MNELIENMRLNRPETIEIDMDKFYRSDWYKETIGKGRSPAFTFGQMIRKMSGATKVALVEYQDGDKIAIIHLEYEDR